MRRDCNEKTALKLHYGSTVLKTAKRQKVLLTWTICLIKRLERFKWAIHQ